MRSILFIIVLYAVCQPALSQNVELNKVGFPDYKRLFNNQLAYSILKTNKSEYHFYVPPRGINYFNNLRDTLHFSVTINDSNNIANLILKNKVNNFHFSYDDGIAYFDDGFRTIKYSVLFSKNLSNLSIQKDEYPQHLRDSTIGYVYFQNHFTRFGNVNLENGSLNIGIVDRDLNGIINKNDLVVVSEDEFFMTKPNNLTATMIKDLCLLKHYDDAYMITWNDGYYLNIEHLTSTINSNNKFDLTFDGKIPNLVLDDLNNIDLLQAASKNDTSIVTIWSVFTPSCIESIEILNEYADRVIGLEESIESNNNRQTEILFSNYKLNNDEINRLGFNGFPNYVVIDKELNILFHSRSIKETMSFYKGHD